MGYNSVADILGLSSFV